ncbi:GDSL-type esterase/lipase family protein [Desulfosporosinus sp. Sb-LF]|uniref:GDSL-type esterase/lipase family protein n=1 Tax=Desulfosporosinus sp. Sb-LF TaxID=2560027 RepID=UPI00107FAD6C|nr:GDSL-type esterase/lipase family protein [Desulfosporosinus sp. Sb-LF]TGE31698.1 hypothetical protein E4K68_15915 [Desulfosporosinus sp. Sb-LF]
MRLRNTSISVFIINLMVLLILTMLIPRDVVASPVSVSNLVSLGDSIAYGTGAPTGLGYTDLFFSYLQSKQDEEGIQLFNLSKPGAKSSGLLNQLRDDGTLKDPLAHARVVTVSIGGNNLLEPVIRAVATAYHLDLNSPQLGEQLVKALQTDKELNKTFYDIALSGTLETELNSGVAEFEANWPQIIGTIKTSTPEAQIFALTVYNPFSPGDIMFSLFDPFVQQINTTIRVGQGYTVADIYSCFLQGFDLKPLNFDFLQGHIDPHPTQQGHKMIFQTLSILFDLAEASPWESKTGVVANKTWTIKFSTSLAESAGEFIQVYTATGLPVNVSLKQGGLWSDSLIVSPPHDGYPPGLYSLYIKSGLPAKLGLKLDRSMRMDFIVE